MRRPVAGELFLTEMSVIVKVIVVGHDGRSRMERRRVEGWASLDGLSEIELVIRVPGR
jgi:hypothetical protein